MKENSWSDREVEAHWDSVADIYIAENEKVRHAHVQRFLETVRHLELSAGQKLLNVSSRDCEAEDYIAKACPGVEIIHAEISSGLMRVAAERRPAARQVKLDTYSSLPFGDGEFDRIISLETLEHVAEPGVFLSELYRVAKRGTKMVLSCPPATSEIPYRVFTWLFGGHGEGPHRFPPSGEVKNKLAKAGWKLILHRGTVLLPVGPVWIQDTGEWIIRKMQKTFIRELGIRQFYVCEK
ncbi:MAG: methyltransferase domain-containing protein [Deltaproteobacteria bacterium]